MAPKTAENSLRTAPAFVLLASLVGGCASVQNLTDPNGPRFEGAYSTRTDDATDAPIRVVTFNIQFARKIDVAADVLRRATELRGADLIALQEMDAVGVERIAKELGLNYVYFPSCIHPKSHGGYFGPAVLSPWPIDHGWKVLLPHEAFGRGQRRTATAAVVRVRGRAVRFYSVHLETMIGAAPYEQDDQAKAVLDDAATSTDPVVVAGDFNSHDVGDVFEARGFLWPTERVGRTTMIGSWDHVFVRGLELRGSKSVGSIADIGGASDHRPVWVVLSRGGA